MTQELPDYYDDLDGSLNAAKSLLLRGAKDRKCDAHHPIVATIDPDGRPRQRVMILRGVDWGKRQLRFHTDVRSAKVGELDVRDDASVLIYDEKRKIQLRLGGIAYASKGEEADTPWANSTNFARRCYLADPAPGAMHELPTSGLALNMEGRQPTEDEVAPGRKNFAVLLFTFDELEWLYLANAGHRRAKYEWDNTAEKFSSTWLVP